MSQEIYFAMTGATGRMGQTIIELSKDYKSSNGSSLQLKGAIDQNKDNQTITINKQEIAISSNIETGLKGVDVVIDFSSPDLSSRVCDYCTENKIPLISGTTGLSDQEKQKFHDAAKIIPIILSPNMSIGVNLLFEITNLAARILNTGYDIEIIEAHHHFKKDAPSGTAVKLKEILLTALDRDESNVIYGRKGISGERNKKEIGVHTMRGGDVVGDHTVHFFGDGERIELTHKASSRSTFATGALKAATWIIDQKPGNYSMRDVLGLDQLIGR